MRYQIITAAAAVMLLLAGCKQTEQRPVSAAYVKSSEVPPTSLTTVTSAAPKITPTETTASVMEEKTSTVSKAVTTSVKSSVTTVPNEITTRYTTAETTAKEERLFESITTTAETQETTAEESATESVENEVHYDTFFGVLIDEDCSDFEDPPKHDTDCMFMTECRASGYGLDIMQEDGSWVFYMFDENGQQLAWEYLNKTSRADGLYVSVEGVWEDNLIKVNSIEEV